MMLSNEVHLYFAHPGQITDTALLDCYKALLSDEEMAQMQRFYFARHRHQYLITRALVRTSLSAHYEIEPHAWRFTANGYGKPEVRLPDGPLAIRFNLSHADGLILCGVVCDVDIGVDVEDAQRSTRAALNRLSSYFSVQEIEDLKQLPERLQKQRFFDYWTLKESYIKARGAGLSIPLNQFSFKFHADKLSGFSIHPELNDDAANWQFWRSEMGARYRVAIAINSRRSDFTVHAVNAVPLQSAEPIALTFI